MPVVEYKLHKTKIGKEQPPFIIAGGHWGDSDNTLVGWIEEAPDYHIPTLVHLSKEDLVSRILKTHEKEPFTKPDEHGHDHIKMTVEEASDMAASWYESFVAENS